MSFNGTQQRRPRRERGLAQPRLGDDPVGLDPARRPPRADGGRSSSARPTRTSCTASGDDALSPAGGGTFGGSIQYVGGPTANPVNAWTHVALTYDGANLRLYVNGTQAATRAATGAIQTTTNPLWIGGNQPYGEYFQGLIDEARVYNRALTQPEIQTDMNAPLAWSGLASPLM